MDTKQIQSSIPSELLKPSSQSRNQLLSTLRLLHLIYHRNKNQHKQSLWFRHLNRLRREVKWLSLELGVELGPGFSDETAKTPKSVGNSLKSSEHIRRPPQIKISIGRATIRVNHWLNSDLIPCCYNAFSSLSTTPSFSPLALTLLALLARLCSLTGVIACLQAIAKLEVDKDRARDEQMLGEALEKFAKEDAGDLIDAFGNRRLTSARLPTGGTKEGDVEDDDLGTVVARDEVAQSTSKSAATEGSRPDRPRKRKKKDNAIDDLFADL